MKAILSAMVLAVLACTFSACKKDTINRPPSPYFVRLTDAPGPYTAVNIDLQSVEVTTSNGAAVTLNTTPGIYNLLNFTNGLDTLIATGSLTTDRVQQIRLILGANNSVVIGGTTYPLSTPSAQQSGLKLQVHQSLQAGVAYYVLLDFDANQSIVDQGNGTYSLKPVIRTVETALSGAIKGSITPAGVAVTITATSGTNTYSTNANANGDFILAGLPPGTYTLTISPAAPYNASTINSVNVTIGTTTNVGVITI